MGGYFDTEDVVWDLPGHRPIAAKELREYAPQRAGLDRIQLCMDDHGRPHASTIRTLRKQFFDVRPDIELRVYLANKLDLTFLEELPMLQHLTIEARGGLSNLATLAQLDALRTVNLELPKNVATDILTHLPVTVEHLALSPDDGKSADVDLRPLHAFSRLESLRVACYERGLASLLPTLKRLKNLQLRSIKQLKNLDAIAGLSRLRKVVIQLGSIDELDVLRSLPNVRYLQLWRIAKLRGVEFVSEMVGLKGLFLETLNTVVRFPAAGRLNKLRIVKLAAMKALRDLSELEHAPALEELVFQKADHQRPEDFVPVLRNPSLKRGGFGFHKKADVARMESLLTQYEIDGEVYMYPQVRGAFEE